MTSNELEIVEILINALQESKRVPTPCTLCLHFKEDETCNIVGVRPQAAVIVTGCERFYRDIPF